MALCSNTIPDLTCFFFLPNMRRPFAHIRFQLFCGKKTVGYLVFKPPVWPKLCTSLSLPEPQWPPHRTTTPTFSNTSSSVSEQHLTLVYQAGRWRGSRLGSSPFLSLCLFAGDMGVGKSCLLHQFTEKKCKCCLDFTVSFHRRLCMHACLCVCGCVCVYVCVQGCQVQLELLNHFRFFIRQRKSVAEKCKLDSVSQLQPPIAIQLRFCLAPLLTRQILCAWFTSSHITSCARTHTHTQSLGSFRRRSLVWDELLLQRLRLMTEGWLNAAPASSFN